MSRLVAKTFSVEKQIRTMYVQREIEREREQERERARERERKRDRESEREGELRACP